MSSLDPVARGLAVGAGQAVAALRTEIATKEIQNMLLDQRYLVEGDPFSVSGTSTLTAVAAGQQSGSGLTGPSLQIPKVAKVVWIENITVSSSHLCDVTPLIASDTAARFDNIGRPTIVAPGAPLVIPIRKAFRAFEMNANGTFAVNLRANLSGATADIRLSFSIDGWRITDDFDYAAKNVILWAGDSTANGTGYTTTQASHMAKVRDYFRGLGSRARLLLKSRSGSNTSDHELWRQGGWYDVPQADICFYDVQINDAATGVAAGDVNTSGTVVYNVNMFWQYWKARNPGKRLVILGCGPLENDTYEALAATYRTALSAYVVSIANPLLVYINTGDAFDRTKGLTFYSSSDTAGNRIHRNDVGEAAVGAKINAGLAAQNITLP